MRQMLLDPESDFRREMVAYLEACHSGDFFTGTHEEVEKRVPVPAAKEQGIYTVLQDKHEEVQDSEGYQNPTLHFPEGPPGRYCNDDHNCDCSKCEEINSWFQEYLQEVDDLLLRCNVHTCYAKRDASNKGRSHGDPLLPKKLATGKGCVDRNGICTARFPRETSQETIVSEKDGHITMRKREPWMNFFTRGIVYTQRCNTDTTSLQSGTGIKATVGYVCDYLTKTFLKTYQIFSTMYDVWQKNVELVDSSREPTHGARRMILKIVNAIGAKMEIGAPMAAMYLLGNPDHYTSHSFVNFYWKNYYNFVRNAWVQMSKAVDPSMHKLPEQSIDVLGWADGSRSGLVNEQVVIGRSNDEYISKSSVDDYRFRPIEHEDVCLYEWIQCNVRRKRGAAGPKVAYHSYLPDHPMHATHEVGVNLGNRSKVVPNFLGPSFPRKDHSNDDEYYCAVLVLFKPWRTGTDLKAYESTWKEQYEKESLPQRYKDVVAFLNLRYECYDARDDFFAQRKAMATVPNEGEETDSEDGDWMGRVQGDWLGDMDVDYDDGELLAVHSTPNRGALRSMERANEVATALAQAGWQMSGSTSSVRESEVTFRPPPIDANMWQDVITAEKSRLWKEKLKMFSQPLGATVTDVKGNVKPVKDTVFVAGAHYFSKSYVVPSVKWEDEMNSIVRQFGLNEEQERAFRIVANHSTAVAPDQLLMYLAGMAGAGKTRVINALVSWFSKRGEPYRIVLLGPTGSSAALIGGSTYHAFLSIRTGAYRTANDLATLEEVRERMYGVQYIVLDEISMVSCEDLTRISARLGDVNNENEKPFGGLNFIAAGDFAQLPPVQGASLYSSTVRSLNSARQSDSEQKKSIGKRIWRQFTTVVLLTKNMRQTMESPMDHKFRKALMNLRYRACTQDDIEFLQSLIGTRRQDVSLSSEDYRNVSVITAFNLDKDCFNSHNTNRFVLDNNEVLESFYSIDTLTSEEVGTWTRKGPVNESVTRLTPGLRKLLWNQLPSTSEQVPACLKLCKNLPVLIRYNVATDLCMTRGQEAVVVSWTSSEIPGFPGYQRLETLFVQLVNPPREVNVPGLPKNVVPLVPQPSSIKATLPSGTSLRIRRRQIPVLPNFAMTDYSSQGKTRGVNVVDLKYAQSHQAIYTALSRGTKADKTFILREFDTDKLSGPMTGGLRQEFRDLELLNHITKLRYDMKIDEDAVKATREETIREFKMNHADSLRKLKLHRVLEGDDDVEESEEEGVERTMPARKRKHPDQKHTDSERHGKSSAPLTARSTGPAAEGPCWDSRDHSCAYDATTFVLYNCWKENPVARGRAWAQFSSIMQVMIDAFARVGELSLSRARDNWRVEVRNQYPGEFPAGTAGVALCDLLPKLFGYYEDAGLSFWNCQSCGMRFESNRQDRIDKFMLLNTSCENADPSLDQLFRNYCEMIECPTCTRLAVSRQNNWDDLLCINLGYPNWNVVPRAVTQDGKVYYLVGAVYLGSHHFTARWVSQDGCIFFHDGIATKEQGLFEGYIHEHSQSWWQQCRGRDLCAVWYCRQ